MNTRRSEEQDARLAQQIAAKAAKRLDYLEWVILAGAALVATGGGALVAVLFKDLMGLPFRPTWIGSAVLLFVVPGSVALHKVRKEEKDWRERKNQLGQEPDV